MSYETVCSIFMRLDIRSFLSLTPNRDLGAKFHLFYNLSIFPFLCLPK